MLIDKWMLLRTIYTPLALGFVGVVIVVTGVVFVWPSAEVQACQQACVEQCR